MPDYGTRVADKQIDQTAAKIRAIYRKAEEELREKLADFQRKYEKKNKEMLAKLEAGEITKKEYQRWLSGQVFIGKQWQDKVDQAAKIMNDANREAAEVVRTGRLYVFAENYNFSAFQIEKQTRVMTTFNVHNEKSVGRLIKRKPKMLPEWKIDEPKDYRWNRQRVENSITQGIIQGEGVREITNRLVETLVTGNRNKMKTFARTAITGAQNAGRQEVLEEAEEDGIKVKKRWLATLDDRTRDTHAELDGQTVDPDEPFTVSVDGIMEEIMYPGDPNALPCLVYNCRCALDNVVVGYEKRGPRRAYREWDDENGKHHRESYIVDGMTYNEWKKLKGGK